MINWKTCIGVSLLMIAGIEFLNIKDMYSPDRITISLKLLTIVFGLTLAASTCLIISGLTPLIKKFIAVKVFFKYAAKFLATVLAKPFL